MNLTEIEDFPPQFVVVSTHGATANVITYNEPHELPDFDPEENRIQGFLSGTFLHQRYGDYFRPNLSQTKKQPISWFVSPELPTTEINITEMAQTIDEARTSIVGMENDWDGENVFEYQEETFHCVETFLYQLAKKGSSPEINRVQILPSSEGSIDLYWKEEHFELLINFSPDGSGDYYGDNYKGESIRGKTSYPKPGFIACWMESLNE